MKMYVISDNHDTLTGLRLSGIDGVLMTEKSATINCIDKVISDEDIGILLITEKLAEQVKDKIDYIRMNLSTPLIVEIPGRNGSGRKKDFITSYINEKIGVNI